MDLLLDAESEDLDLSDDQVTLVDGADAIRQHLQVRFRLFKGECFLNTNVGMPYFQRILVKNPNLLAIRGIFRRAIIATPGIEQILTFAFEFDAATRVATLTFSAKTDEDEILVFDEEFVIA
jgi:hypothetical protein